MIVKFLATKMLPLPIRVTTNNSEFSLRLAQLHSVMYSVSFKKIMDNIFINHDLNTLINNLQKVFEISINNYNIHNVYKEEQINENLKPILSYLKNKNAVEEITIPHISIFSILYKMFDAEQKLDCGICHIIKESFFCQNNICTTKVTTNRNIIIKLPYTNIKSIQKALTAYINNNINTNCNCSRSWNINRNLQTKKIIIVECNTYNLTLDPYIYVKLKKKINFYKPISVIIQNIDHYSTLLHNERNSWYIEHDFIEQFNNCNIDEIYNHIKINGINLNSLRCKYIVFDYVSNIKLKANIGAEIRRLKDNYRYMTNNINAINLPNIRHNVFTLASTVITDGIINPNIKHPILQNIRLKKQPKQIPNKIGNLNNFKLIKHNAVLLNFTECIELHKLFDFSMEKVHLQHKNQYCQLICDPDTVDVAFGKQKGKDCIIYDNNLFVVTRNRSKKCLDLFCWSHRHSNINCKGKIKIKFDYNCNKIKMEIVKKCCIHEKTFKLKKFFRHYVLTKIKQVLDNHNEHQYSTRALYNDIIGNIKRGLCNSYKYPLPTYSAVSRSIRTLFAVHKRNINSISSLVEYLQKLSNLKYIRREDSNSIFFYNIKSLQRLCNTAVIFGDGTFILPRFNGGYIHCQIYRLDTGLYNDSWTKGITLPCILALLERKKQDEYDWLFDNIKMLLTKNNLKLDINCNGMLDYEYGARKAFAIKMNRGLLGDMFHFIQSILKKLGKLGLFKFYKKGSKRKNGIYKNNINYCVKFRFIITQITALCMVPPDLIEVIAFELFKDLCEWVNSNQRKVKGFNLAHSVKLFIEYMINTWIDLSLYGSHKALYQNLHWNCAMFLIKSNNPTEQQNRWMQICLGKYYTCYELINWFTNELDNAELIYHQYVSNNDDTYLNQRKKVLLFKYGLLMNQFEQLCKYDMKQKQELKNNDNKPNIYLNEKDVDNIKKIMQNIGDIITVYRKLKWDSFGVM